MNGESEARDDIAQDLQHNTMQNSNEYISDSNTIEAVRAARDSNEEKVVAVPELQIDTASLSDDTQRSSTDATEITATREDIDKKLTLNNLQIINDSKIAKLEFDLIDKEQLSEEKEIDKKKKLKKNIRNTILIATCGLIGVSLVVSISAILLLPKAYGVVNYRDSYTLGRKASDTMYDVLSFESCRGVLKSVDSTYTSKKTYGNYIQKCKDNLGFLQNAVAELAKDAAIINDEELNSEWQKFKEVYEKTLPLYMSMLEIYPDWHNFSVNIVELTKDGEWWKTATEQSIDEAYMPIVKSKNQKLSEWGAQRAILYKQYMNSYKIYKEAYNAYYSANYSAPDKIALREDMQAKSAISDDAYGLFKKYDNENVMNMELALGADLNSSDYNMSERMSDLFDKIHNKYLEAHLLSEKK